MDDLDFIKSLELPIDQEIELINRFRANIAKEQLFKRGQELFTQIGHEHDFKALIEEIKEVIWIFDLQKQKVVYVSPAFKEIWHLEPNDILQDYSLWEKSIHPDDKIEADASFRKIIETGGGKIRDYRIVRPDGEVRWISDRGFIIKGENEIITKIVGIAEDITEQKQAQQSLKESEQNYRLLVENPSVAIFRVNTKGEYKFINSGFTEMLGYSIPEVFSLNGFDYIHPDDLHQLNEVLKPLYHGKTVDNINYRFQRADGTYAHLFTSFAPIISETGEIYEFMGICRDISEQKIAEQQQRKSEIKFSSLLKTSKDFIHIMNTSGIILKTNQAAVDGTGYTREEIEGSKMTKFFTKKSQQIFQENFPQLLKTGSNYAEVELIHKSGKIMEVECKGSAIFDDDGNITALISFQRDITKQKKHLQELQTSQADLRDSQELFSMFMDNIQGSIYLRDLDGKYLYVNKYAEEHVFGKNWREMKIKDLFDVEEVKFKEKENKVILQQKILDQEDTIRHLDGTVRTVKSIKFRIDRPKKDPLIGGIALDITDQKALEEELIKIQKLESLGILAGGIAHDFNNILTSILGNLSLLKYDINPDSEQFESLNEVEKATIRAKDLTNQLLTFSKGGAPIKKTANLKELIQESVNFVLRGSKVKCVYDLADDLSTVEIDRGQINQVINNIAINADQAMSTGGELLITARNFTQKNNSNLPLSSGNYVQISFHDTGTGIPKEFQEKIFSPFFTTKEHGSGLGLATSFSIISRHGGLLTFSSIIEEGTTFFIYLPASQHQVKLEQRAKKTQQIPYNYRILVMDDEETVLKTISMMLKKLKCFSYITYGGIEAISILGEEFVSGHGFDAVILDLTIPGDIGGLETLTKIREIDPTIFAIVSSGYSTDPVMANYEKYGFDYAIPKPFTLEELRLAIEKIDLKKKKFMV
ncbi:Adaptive-response sensory-kinase SasA [Candidatus Lokiarchaeum ossiferum]|uniref:histidine kinase n=1 Tax=Candidatus Lokiarchaeum ossiferum TaxID=2951803 RepID=A0ABY6HY10_9ARCH|nr:Adaptive-response sensory-kinase SasA [Candidatus Lokiarchaeum sp. B-35]